MTDFLLFENLYKMIKDTPKPRMMFRKGITARGYFRPYMAFSDHTKAQLFDSPDRITPVTVRFSSMLGDNGTADTVRNIKGMDVKFSTSQGKYDMMCRSLSVAFINEPSKFEALRNAFTRRIPFDGINKAAFWRFITENPEAVNCGLRLFSHRGLSDSYIYIDMFSVNTVIWENKYGEKWLVRCRWKPIIERESEHHGRSTVMDLNTAEFLAGFDADRGLRQIASSIAKGSFPCFELQLQMMKYSRTAERLCIIPTLCWNEKLHPPVAAGRMTLQTLEENFRESELLSFAPGRTVEGIALCRNEMADFLDHLYRIEAAERGGIE